MQLHTRTVTIPTNAGDPDRQDSPTGKAAHVADLVRAYREVCDNGEPLETVIVDMIADLLHYGDTLPEEECDTEHDSGPRGWSFTRRALNHYADEVGE